MTELSTLSDIFGRSAWPMIKEMGEVEVFDVDVNKRSCSMILDGQEYEVKRTHHCGWHVATVGYQWTFGSQWELLAWVGDRL